MIISHKYKYIFIGLPFSASSAISKELIENYEGVFILNKHANIQTYLKNNKLVNIEEYKICAVHRNIEDILFTRYNKFKYNHKGIWTDPKYLVENGGHITKKSLNRFAKIQNNDLNFEGFLKETSKGLPFDSRFSINAPYLTHILRFNNLDEDFENFIKAVGLNFSRPLPKTNKTKIKDAKIEISNAVREKLINPYYSNIAKHLPEFSKQPAAPVIYILLYKILNLIRKLKWLAEDKNRSDKQDGYLKKKLQKAL